MKYARIDDDIKRLQEEISNLENLKNFSCFSCEDAFCIHARTGFDDCCPSHSKFKNKGVYI